MKKKKQIDMMKQTDKIDYIKTGRHIYPEVTNWYFYETWGKFPERQCSFETKWKIKKYHRTVRHITQEITKWYIYDTWGLFSLEIIVWKM